MIDKLGKDKYSLNIEKILIALGGILTVTCWISLILGEFGLFFKPLLYATTVIVVGFSFLWIRRNVKYFKMERLELLTLILVIFIAAFNSFFFHDTFFGNRDEGVYANGGVTSSKYHSFKIKADLPPTAVWLKNREWLQPSFPFGYPAWLGFNYSLFGIKGIFASSFLLIVVTLLSIYSISKLLGSRSAGLMACIFISFSYPFLWFWRRTVSENLVTALVWFGLFSCLLALKKGDKKLLLISLLSFGFTLHIRDEPLFLCSILLAIIFGYSVFSKKGWIASTSLLTILPIFAHFVFYIFMFRQGEINNVLHFLFTAKLIKIKVPVLNDELPEALPTALHFHLPEFTLRLISQYCLYFPILFVIFTPIFLFIKKRFREAGYFFLLFLVFAPLFYALKSPNIVYDQPWMLRRYLIGVFPLAFLSFSFFLSQLTNKKMMVIIFSFFLLTELTVSFPLLLLSEYKGMVKNIGKIVQDIPKNSIVFTDRFTFTDYYEIDAPIFSIYDIPSTRTYYDNIENTVIPPNTDIYFVTHENNWRNDQDVFSQFFPKESWRLTLKEKFLFVRLERTCELLKKYGMPGLVERLPIKQAIDECNQIPSNAERLETNIVVYRINRLAVEQYLLKQEMFREYGKRNIYFQPRSSYEREGNSLVCLKSSCIVRYYLPRLGENQGILLFAEPKPYPEKFNISILAEGKDIKYAIFNFDTNEFNEIESKYIKDGSLNFDADTTYFQETYVLRNFINIKITSPSPIKFKNIEIIPKEK